MMSQHQKLRFMVGSLTALLVFVLIPFISPVAYAQTGGIEIQISPQFPEPNETLAVSATAYSLDLNRASISWYINGELTTQGIGATHTKMELGPAGTATTIEIVAQGMTGTPVRASRTIRPAYVGIAWEADTYTPPLYQSKALLSPGAMLRLVAMPALVDESGETIPADQLVYVWKREGRVVPEISGYGKQAVSIINDTYLRPLEVIVEVSNRSDTVRARDRIIIPIASTAVRWYEDHPLLGIKYMDAVSDSFIMDHETTLIAEPFHYSVSARSDDALEYVWQVNHENSGFTAANITLRPQGSQPGKAELSVTTRHLSQLLQSNRTSHLIQFIPTPIADEQSVF